jgi:hypothetical protein
MNRNSENGEPRNDGKIFQRHIATPKHRENRSGDCFFAWSIKRALEIVEESSSYEKVTKQREFVTYKGKHGGRECDTGCCWCSEIYLPNHKITQIFTGEQ